MTDDTAALKYGVIRLRLRNSGEDSGVEIAVRAADIGHITLSPRYGPGPRTPEVQAAYDAWIAINPIPPGQIRNHYFIPEELHAPTVVTYRASVILRHVPNHVYDVMNSPEELEDFMRNG